MENNEISMFMNVKLDIHDKRPDSLKFKSWTRCQVKIEAIKCLPCFLRITLHTAEASDHRDSDAQQHVLCFSIIVPGVTISLAVSRTMQYSYGIFWTHNRRDRYIYFGLETEANCRRHMKWIKKSIKNLELYRQILLEQRRNSKGTARFGAQGVAAEMTTVGKKGYSEETTLQQTELSPNSRVLTALGPLPQVPDSLDASCSLWAQRISEIYEEIYEGNQPDTEHPHLSRRFSRTSIASGIYEEMKPTGSNFNAIVEELLETAPPVPPLPPPRKRINTFETDNCGLLGEIPRSNTNPESELAKKKKYKNVLDNIFGGARSKRAVSVSESQACSVEDFIGFATPTSNNPTTPTLYANSAIVTKRQRKPHKLSAINMAKSKRNSFSSPDLSKINLIDTFDEEKVTDILNSFSTNDELDLNIDSLDESGLLQHKSGQKMSDQIPPQEPKKKGSLESLNISQQIPNNFNFSACNSSTINLIGAFGDDSGPNTRINKILIDDLTGYCIMAPIKKKPPTAPKGSGATQPQTAAESASSGYSTGSYCSSTSSCTNSTEDHLHPPPTPEIPSVQASTELNEESVIYENMLGALNATSTTTTGSMKDSDTITAPVSSDFSGNLYENLLTVKAAQELEHTPSAMSTSTPTDSPHTQTGDSPSTLTTVVLTEEEEDYYQTPRKSIISVDDKIPSYYPNSCDTVKMRRFATSPFKATSPAATLNEKATTSVPLRQLVGMKMRRERKENVYISSPQKIIEQRHISNTSSTSAASPTSTTSVKSTKSNKPNKKTAAHKIAANVYAVTHPNKKSTNRIETSTQDGFTDEMKDKLQTELLQLAMLQNIDFKFDDTRTQENQPPKASELMCEQQDERELSGAENCYRTTDADCFLKKFSPAPQHHLQLNQAANTKGSTPTATPGPNGHLRQTTSASKAIPQSKLDPPVVVGNDLQMQWSGVKKFASLPRFKKIDFSPLKLRINNVLQRNQQHEF